MNDWYYWGKNQHSHYIVFRNPEDKVASGTITEANGMYEYRIEKTRQPLLVRSGTVSTIKTAKEAVELVVNKIIEETFAEEYIPPLG